jgi:nicotinate-nucleotide pyrophosphorylase (carboxylating)
VVGDVSERFLLKKKGPARKILVGERTALNLLARASGIATAANRAAKIARHHHFKVCRHPYALFCFFNFFSLSFLSFLFYQGTIAATRKTTPGFRIVEKFAVLVGGCDMHRMDLSSMIMIKVCFVVARSSFVTLHCVFRSKDNHVWSTGSITNAVKKARSVGGFAVKIEVECQNENDADEAIKAGTDIVMLDNFAPHLLRETAKSLKSKYPHALIEASGGITVENMSVYLSEYVDVISIGALTQGVPFVDFSLKVNRPSN